MKVFTPEISWHQKKPVFSVDFCKNTWKLASSGGDFTIKIWQVKVDDKEHIGLDFLSDLDRHDKAVNTVKFSPDGKFLASAGDDCIIIIWRLATAEEESKAAKKIGDDEIYNKETWVVHKILRRGHLEDIYDLSWSPDGSKLISGSIDNSAIVWNVEEAKYHKILSEHKHFVQGVCWDPRGEFYASLSSDRTCRLYDAVSERCLYSIAKTSYQVETEEGLKKKSQRIFLGETMQLFFRRCTFSPDGSLLALPGGVFETSGKTQKTTFIFSRKQLNKPILHLPSTKKASTAVCFCPVAFELVKHDENDQDNSNLLGLPYRQLFAVVTLDSILLYDTQHFYPFGFIKNVHLSFLTDITWSSDGRFLVISSEDGYCSIVNFSKDELGTPISYDCLQYQVQRVKAIEERKQAIKLAEQSKAAARENANTDIQSPRSACTVKEGSKPKDSGLGAKVASPNQPTLEMLMSSSRKRKRPKSASPPESVSVKTTCQADGELANKNETQDKQATGSITSPRASAATPKQPRRINFSTCKQSAIVIQEDGEESSTKESSGVAPPKQKPLISPTGKRVNSEVKANKPPKRAQLISTCPPKQSAGPSLCTSASNATGAAQTSKTASITSPVPVNKGTQLQLKPAKRAALITIEDSGPNLLKGAKNCEGAQKPPKRVQVLTLSKFESNSKGTNGTVSAEQNCANGNNEKLKDIKDITKASPSLLLCNGTNEAATSARPTVSDVGTDIAKNGLDTPEQCSSTLGTQVQDSKRVLCVDLTSDENSNDVPMTAPAEDKSRLKAPKRVALCTLQTYDGQALSETPQLTVSKTGLAADPNKETTPLGIM